MQDINVAAIKACPMDPEANDAEASTVGEYLIKVLETVWTDENASGKRIFGNSGWHYEVYKALVQQRLVIGSLDEDGYVESVDKGMAVASVMLAIRSLR